MIAEGGIAEEMMVREREICPLLCLLVRQMRFRRRFWKGRFVAVVVEGIVLRLTAMVKISVR